MHMFQLKKMNDSHGREELEKCWSRDFRIYGLGCRGD